MQHPLIYEINVRWWLRELAECYGQSIHLGNVPEPELARWQDQGFTHIWLMGVWPTGPRSRQRVLNEPVPIEAWRKILADFQESDVAGSPYAVADYTVPRTLGGQTALQAFRQQLHAHDLKLLLDFVPNHVGLDHQWLTARPELFVQSEVEVPDTLPRQTPAGQRWLAHGKDPNFPAWTDTVQLDYRRADTRAAMLEVLGSVAELCDGVRCDVAMLVLNEVFARTWEKLPSQAPAVATSEFWPEAIGRVKQAHPDFLFLAEVYWDLEARLQTEGFDYTYDKRLYDRLVTLNFQQVQRHLLSVSPRFIKASAHFLENHDEARVAALLEPRENQAAALVILGLPGLRLLHDGQLSGARVRTPVQLGRRPHEPPVPGIVRLYDQLLKAIKQSAVGHGNGTVLQPREAWPGNPTCENFVTVQWQATPPTFDLVTVNLAPHRSQCYAPLSIAHLPDHNWLLRDVLGGEKHERRGDDLNSQGLYLDLPPLGAQLFHFEPVS
jgi:hypothetical protein